MAAPRTPLKKLKLMGSTITNPARFKDRREPASVPLGEPSPYLTDMQQAAWRSFQAEIPWLAESDRALLELACQVRARMLEGELLTVNYLTVLRQCLSAMGATPADRSRVAIAGDQPEDPLADYFNA